ncbi:MAG: coenzyme F430 synthase [Methanolobus sp.]|nr:coenzyme F430 synthase [Methanolobus sp.]
MLDLTNIAVLDMTHAGTVIAEGFARLGYNVKAIDVYGTVDEDILLRLGHEYGIVTSKGPVTVDDLDLIVCPVHLDPGYPMLADARKNGVKIIDHHRAVGHILSMNGFFDNTTVVEVTGSKAKTSTVSLLADMLSRKMKVILHSSRGLELWEKGHSHVVHLGLSIAPGSVLLAIAKLMELDIVADCYIFEFSLGLTGFADVGVITTLEPEYMIAASTSSSSDSKMKALLYGRPDEVFFLNLRDRKAVDVARTHGRKYFTFNVPENSGCAIMGSAIEGADLQLRLEGNNIYIDHAGFIFSSSLSPNYNFGSYATAFAAASSVAIRLDVFLEDIITVLGSFEGLQGRMQEKELSGRKLIDNSNSGMDIRSCERALDYALCRSGSPGKVIMVLGEEAAQVCEGLPPENVEYFLSRRCEDIGQLILVGQRMQKISLGNVTYASGLEQGLEMAICFSSPNDIILSCVKCFR